MPVISPEAVLPNAEGIASLVAAMRAAGFMCRTQDVTGFYPGQPESVTLTVQEQPPAIGLAFSYPDGRTTTIHGKATKKGKVCFNQDGDKNPDHQRAMLQLAQASRVLLDLTTRTR